MAGAAASPASAHAELIAESALQLRELYQAEQDSRQNRIMGLLTVVTTLFLPLTLLTGWDGMNFRNMPELTWLRRRSSRRPCHRRHRDHLASKAFPQVLTAH